MKFINSKSKIVFALFIAFFISSFLVKILFIPNDIKINYQYLANLFKKNNSKFIYDKLITTSLSAMTPLSKGIYAKEEKNLNTTFIRITKNAKWKIVIDEVNGEKIKVLVPSDFQL